MRVKIFLFFYFFSLTAFSQTPYGNDWINFSQTYYKIKIAADGVYRITKEQLQQAGLPVSQINPKNIQVFNKGAEIALYITGESDGVLDNGDYIEFYGRKNDGQLDKPLYNNPADQPHDYYSLYTDTAAYFLTWTSSTPGKRYSNLNLSTTGLTAEPYFMYSALSFFTDGGYYPGQYILAETSVSEYTAGEGILGSSFYHNSPQIRALATPGLYTGGTIAITGECYVSGRSNSATTDPQGFNHHLRIEISNNGTSFTTKKDTSFRGYSVVRPSFSISPAEISDLTSVRFSAVNNIGAATDYQAAGYIKITYPRRYDLSGLNSLKFTLKGFQTGSNSLLQFTNASVNNAILLDLTNNRRIATSISNNILEAVVPGAGTEKEIFLYDAANFQTATLQAITFNNLQVKTSDKTFLLITHKSLLAKAQEYAVYREQTGYKTLLITTDQLYDQFYYGVHHPFAIRNFCKYLLDKALVRPEYLLLLGKGQSHFYVRSNGGLEKDLVPGIGNPPSDNMLTSGLNGTRWEPAIATGRIAAKTPEEVEIYLNKLKAYEQQPDSLWRKKLIHVSGGNSLFENLQWSGYQKNFLAESSKEFLGAYSVDFHKNVTEPVTDNISGKIINEINKGTALLSFFGHGSAQATEINFGEPSALQNQNKLLVYMINGCNAGNPFTETSLGEKMIFQPEKAAIGWLATSDEGVASYLGNFSTIFYRNSFKLNYGKSIAQNLQATVSAYQNPNDILNQTHSRQYIWQGDPALKFYSPAKPDYYIQNKDLFIYPEDVSAVTDSFAVAIIVKNLGKAINTPINVSIKHIFPDDSQTSYPNRRFNPVYNNDTLFFYIKPEKLKTAGSNKFIVTLDSDNQISELNETNNTAEFNFIMPSNGVNILSPAAHSIVNTTPVILKAQPSNLLSENQEYIFEIDTINTFNSPWKKSSGIIVQNSLPSWSPSFTPENNKVYYWRVKINVPEGEGGVWQQSVFTYIPQSPEGWNQSHRQQFETISTKGIHFNSSQNIFSFDNTTFVTSIRTKGDDVSSGEERTYRSIPGGRLGYAYWEFPGIALIALDPKTLKTFTYPSIYNIEGFYRYSGEFHFNINNPVELDSMLHYISNIPDGFYVVGHNGRDISFKDLPESAKSALQSLGLNQFNSVGLGEPYMFWGQKGASAGTAVEKIADPTSSIPIRSQIIYFEKEYYYPFTQGSFTSSLIGPSEKWENADYRFEEENSDIINLTIVGITETGREDVLLQSTGASGSLNLSSINPESYPFLKLKASLTDNTNRTPAQLKSWKVLYQGKPESSINPELKNVFYAKSIQEGDSINWQLSYENISKYATDSVDVFYTLTKADRNTTKRFIKTFPSIQPGSNFIVNLKLPTIGLSGNNSLQMEFIPKNKKDLFSFNNYLNQPFTVIKDAKAPLINVLFDGKNIINSEIVSPKPAITISLTDENNYLLLQDTSVIEVYFKKQDEDDSQYRRESFSSNRLIFNSASSTEKNQATVEYKPERFDDGTYTLKVHGKDVSGNLNSVNDYTIDFQVINESAISNFYPYPNPFTTKMKFVFTLTGDKIPDKMKIQILTSSGKVVREVLKEELGALRIGNNISEFTWDGTDQFGDRLANGVYFYHVVLENNDQSTFNHRYTSGDKFFKNNFGKIYLMR